MKAYLAAGFQRQEEIKQIARKLRQSGIIIASTWHDREESDTDYENFARYAERDLDELDSADTFVLFNGPTTAGGRHVEFGFVLGYNWLQPQGARNVNHYDIHIVGKLENVFQYMEGMDFTLHANEQQLIEHLTMKFARESIT